MRLWGVCEQTLWGAKNALACRTYRAKHCVDESLFVLQIVIPLGAMTWPQKLYDRKMSEEREKSQYGRV